MVLQYYIIMYALCCIISYSYLHSIIEDSIIIRFILTINFALLLTPFAIIRTVRKIIYMMS